MINTERLIAEVKKRLCLWKMDDGYYNERDMKVKAWNEIATIVYPEWRTYGSDEKQQKVAEVQKKWKHIRDYYVREKRNQRNKPTALKKKKYIFFDILTFLDATDTKKSDIVINSDQDNSLTCSNPETNTQVPETVERDVDAQRNVQLRLNRRRRSFNAIQNELRKRQKVTETQNKIDEDKTFLFSLLPSMSRLNGLQKMDFKIEIMKALRKIEYQKQVSSTTYYNNVPPLIHFSNNTEYLVPQSSLSPTSQCHCTAQESSVRNGTSPTGTRSPEDDDGSVNGCIVDIKHNLTE